MPAAARIQVDKIITGHLCSIVAGIAGPGATGPTGSVIVSGSLAACGPGINPPGFIGPPRPGDFIAPHTIRAGKICIPHLAFINTGSVRVNAAGRAMARIGDSADSGAIISGSFRVFIGA